MEPYDPGRFRSTFETKDGDNIWLFLNEDDNILRMETATYLSRAAVEPLSIGLLKTFGDAITEDRTKQMIGHMARQIMERLGYRLDQNGVRITSEGNMFSRASRYSL